MVSGKQAYLLLLTSAAGPFEPVHGSPNSVGSQPCEDMNARLLLGNFASGLRSYLLNDTWRLGSDRSGNHGLPARRREMIRA
jgi:hypothetical protein